MKLNKKTKKSNEEIVEEIMKDFTTCKVCGGYALFHGIVSDDVAKIIGRKTIDLCKKCNVEDLIKKIQGEKVRT